MTRNEALANSVMAVQEAVKHLEAGNTDLSYSWSVIADTWASIAGVMEYEPEGDIYEWETVQQSHTRSPGGS
jgi:hypothetical protein